MAVGSCKKTNLQNAVKLIKVTISRLKSVMTGFSKLRTKEQSLYHCQNALIRRMERNISANMLRIFLATAPLQLLMLLKVAFTCLSI